ncbi:MAG: molybdopterin-dependent oxidoreductase [Verrucomicrobia bacterium]|nr:molybdopterin-dependent oxidoreductase [Verrucomicrobiota bacterium]
MDNATIKSACATLDGHAVSLERIPVNGCRKAYWTHRGPRFILAFALSVAGSQLAALGQGEGGTIATATASPSAVAEPILRVWGQVPAPAAWTTSDWARLPRVEVRVNDRQGREVTYAGVSLCDVLRAAGMKFDATAMPSRATVAGYVVVDAADGYQAVFALAELDPALTDRVILLADRKDGQPLTAGEGPLRVVVPGEKRPARWVRQVKAIWIGRP